MKNLLATILLLSATCICCQAQPASSQQVKVMSYNIRNAIGLDDICNYNRIADVIALAEADIVAIQEIDSVTNRSEGHYVLGEIAAHAQYQPYFAAAIDFDGGKYGIGLLTRQDPQTISRILLPGSEEERTLIVAEFPDYVVANTHLSLTLDDALASVPIIVQAVTSAGKPAIIAGDWNNSPDSPVIAALKEAGFEIASSETEPTFPADEPRECIDYIATYCPEGTHAEIISTSVINEPAASDHRPVTATIRLYK